jgi:hypothetical protein
MGAFNFDPMNKTILIILCFVLSSCAAFRTTSAVSSRDEIIKIGKEEVHRRNILLPANCEITIVEGVDAPEVGPARQEYFVRFVLTRDGKREVIYQVVVDKHSKKVVDFVDYRHTVQGGR